MENNLLNKKYKYNVLKNEWKLIYIKLGVLLALTFIYFNLINLQLVNAKQYSEQSQNNTKFYETIPAPRGIIYDRNYNKIALNQTQYNVGFENDILNLRDKKKAISDLSKVIGLSIDEINNTYSKGSIGESFTLIKESITDEQRIILTTDSKFINEGIQVNATTVRSYPYNNLLSHLLGYIGKVGEDDIANSDGKLNRADFIGKTGLEKQYDNELRGQDGKNIVYFDTDHKIVQVVRISDPIPGNNIILSLDVNIQQKLDEFLANGITSSSAIGGAAILENSNDGSIIAMDSLPSFDNNKFVTRISQDDYNKLSNDEGKPLFDRSIQAAVPPGSVMKTITASAALQEKVINTDTKFDAEGVFEYGGVQFEDYNRIKRGWLNIIGGLQWSSNIFFYNVMFGLGINKFTEYQSLYGVGKLTGIDLPSEAPGQLSDPAVKQSTTANHEVWTGGDSLNAAIGQGNTEVTPIQVVNWISSIANGGYLYKPHLASQINNYLNQTLRKNKPEIINKNFVSSDNLNIIKDGMHEAVLHGIDRSAQSSSVDIAAKTGTAQFGKKDSDGNYSQSHAWTASFAPYTNPQFTLVVFLDSGGLSSNSSIVTRNFYNWLYGDYLKK